MFDDIRRLKNELNRTFKDFWSGDINTRTPLVDVEETDNEIIAKFELPGVEKEDIKLNVSENKIEVKVDKKAEQKIEKEGYYSERRSYEGYYRALPLMQNVVPDKAEAKYEKGILEVRVPKAEKSDESNVEIK